MKPSRTINGTIFRLQLTLTLLSPALGLLARRAREVWGGRIERLLPISSSSKLRLRNTQSHFSEDDERGPRRQLLPPASAAAGPKMQPEGPVDRGREFRRGEWADLTQYARHVAAALLTMTLHPWPCARQDWRPTGQATGRRPGVCPQQGRETPRWGNWRGTGWKGPREQTYQKEIYASHTYHERVIEVLKGEKERNEMAWHDVGRERETQDSKQMQWGISPNAGTKCRAQHRTRKTKIHQPLSPRIKRTGGGKKD